MSSDRRRSATRIPSEAVPISTDPLVVGAPSVAFKLTGAREWTGLPNYVINRTSDRVLAVKNLGKDTHAREIQVVVNWFDSLRRASASLRESSAPAR